MGDYQRELDALWKTDPALAAKLVDLERRELELGTLRTERDELVRKAREGRVLAARTAGAALLQLV